ncbi:hypothetical protein ACOSP7_020778 [Xanthoceras sorbifolium]
MEEANNDIIFSLRNSDAAKLTKVVIETYQNMNAEKYGCGVPITNQDRLENHSTVMEVDRCLLFSIIFTFKGINPHMDPSVKDGIKLGHAHNLSSKKDGIVDNQQVGHAGLDDVICIGAQKVSK